MQLVWDTNFQYLEYRLTLSRSQLRRSRFLVEQDNKKMAGWFYWIADVSLYKCQTFQLLFRGSVIKDLCFFKIQQMHNYIIMEIHWFTIFTRHIDHDAPWLPPKFCINILFNIQYLSLDDCNIQEKLKTKCKFSW